MKNEVKNEVTTPVTEAGIPSDVAKNIKAQFGSVIDRLIDLEERYNVVVELEHTKEREDIAKALRLEYVKTRSETERLHKEQKAFYLAGGRYVDGLKNAQIFACTGKEEVLKQIEETSKAQAAAAKAERLNNRLEALRDAGVRVLDLDGVDIEGMHDMVFDAFLDAQKKEAAKIAKAAKKDGLLNYVHGIKLPTPDQEFKGKDAKRYEKIKSNFIQFLSEAVKVCNEDI